MPPKIDDWFERVYPKWLGPLRKYLCSFVPRQTAEDLAQEAFLQVYTAPNFTNIQNPERFLFRTARNMALNEIKSPRFARTDVEAEVDDIGDPGASVLRRAMTVEEYEMLSDVITDFTPRCQQILILRAFYEWKISEIAKHLGIHRRTVHRELALALKNIHVYRKKHEPTTMSTGTDPSGQVVSIRCEAESTS